MAMRYRMPDYYQQFACLAGECPDTCCAGWQIEIDEKSFVKYVRYHKTGGGFKTRLFNGVDWKEGTFRQGADKRCEFLNEENLCDIYSEAGKGMLCRTCRTYPRHVEEFQDMREISLSLSCPEAARLILQNEDRVSFIEREKKRPAEKYAGFDRVLFGHLLKARGYLIEIAQNRSVPMEDRIAKMLMYTHDFQLCVKRDELKKHSRILEGHRRTGFDGRFQRLISKAACDRGGGGALLPEIWKLFKNDLEVLRDAWPAYLDKCVSILYEREAEDYLMWKNNFLENYKPWEIECEQLLVYWIYTYFAGAVYGGNAYANLKFALVSTLLIREMDIARYIETGGVFTKEDQFIICLNYSREIEHSDVNLRRVERMMRQNELFRLENLLAIR